MANAAAPPADATADGDNPVKKGKLKLILVASLGLVVIGGGVGGYLFWKSSSSSHAAGASKVAVRVPAVFVPLDPPFVVNFQTADAVRFLQVEVRLAAKNAETAELLKQNDPIVRNDLLMLFGNQDITHLMARDGKEKLRAAALQAVRNVIKNVGGEPANVDNVYFTSFVMQ